MEYLFDVVDETEGYSATCESEKVTILSPGGNLNSLLDKIKDYVRKVEHELVPFKVIAFENYDGFKIRVKTH